MPQDSSQQSLLTSLDRRLQFLETEILKKEQTLESLKLLYESGQKELSQTKIELSVAKSYINTLPTQQEVVKLKNTLSYLNEEKQQLNHDIITLKEMNTEFSYKILALQKEVKEKENALQNKAAEVDALNYTIKLWENRRLAAQEAGHVTVEDIVADKIKLQEQFQDMLKIAACREQYFKARIDKMKAQVEQHKFAFDVQREKCDSLQKVIEKFQTESEKSSLDRESLAEAKERLEKDVSRVNFELKQLNAREKSVEKLIVFIRDAISKQFLDPSLLFFTDDDYLKVEPEDGESLDKQAEKRVSEISALKNHVQECQKTITDIYVSNLSNSIDSQCQVQ
uniref:Uncharacterized protein n=1 Tax=Daphnia galeata TaxID=27404 RepID=A0A8J2WEV5_9CRUS|nr:unnamed protein product [Daphnia galeata]